MNFVDSYTELNHKSTVIVRHRNHLYKGTALCHPDDAFSEFTGCRYAQERAEIKALKQQHKEMKAACEECRKFVVAVTQYAGFDPKSREARAMFRQLNRRIKAVNKLAEEIGKRQFNLDVAIKQQESFKKRVNQKRLNSN